MLLTTFPRQKCSFATPYPQPNILPRRNAISFSRSSREKANGSFPLPLRCMASSSTNLPPEEPALPRCADCSRSPGVVHDSIAIAWVPGASHDFKAFQRRGNDTIVKASSPTDIRLAPVNGSEDFPCARLIGECYKVILLCSFHESSSLREMRTRPFHMASPSDGVSSRELGYRHLYHVFVSEVFWMRGQTSPGPQRLDTHGDRRAQGAGHVYAGPSGREALSRAALAPTSAQAQHQKMVAN